MTSPIAARRTPSGACDAVASSFAGSDTGGLPTVGIELELLAHRHAPGTKPTRVHLTELRKMLAGVPHIDFEPGGQVEIHPPPAATATAALEMIERAAAEATARCRSAGIELLATGVEPWSDTAAVPLQLTTERYRLMELHFQRVGGPGVEFMRQTASAQICVGLASGDLGRLQWAAANRIAPILAAVFANAPMRSGKVVGHNGSGTAICTAIDPARTGHGTLGCRRHPVREYRHFSRRARPFLAATGVGDPAHLTTLFPALRPRGTYLEVRSIDALEPRDLRAAVELTVIILAAPDAAAEASDVVQRSLDACVAWQLAAGDGIRNETMRHAADALVRVALEHIGGFDAHYLPPTTLADLERVRRDISRARAPGDRLLCRIAI